MPEIFFISILFFVFCTYYNVLFIHFVKTYFVEMCVMHSVFKTNIHFLNKQTKKKKIFAKYVCISLLSYNRAEDLHTHTKNATS